MLLLTIVVLSQERKLLDYFLSRLWPPLFKSNEPPMRQSNNALQLHGGGAIEQN